MMDGIFAEKMNAGKRGQQQCLLSLLVLLCAASCSGTTDSLGNGCTILKTGDNSEIPLEAIIDTVFQIHLDTGNPDAVVGSVDRMEYFDGNFFLLDRNMRKCLYKYSSEGKFITTIGKRGRGPGEYLQPTDFVIKDSTIIVLDQFSHNILEYDLDGSFVSKTKYDYKIYELAVNSGNGLFAVAGDNRRELKGYEMFQLSDDYEIVGTHFEHRNKLNYIHGSSLHGYNGNITYSPPFRSTIYGVGCDGVYPKYHVNLGSHGLPDDFEEKSKGDYELFHEKFPYSKYHSFNGVFWESDSWIGVGITEESLGNLYVFEKAGRKYYKSLAGIRHVKGSVEKESLYLTAMNSAVAVDGDTLYCYLDMSSANHDDRTVFKICLKKVD